MHVEYAMTILKLYSGRWFLSRAEKKLYRSALDFLVSYIGG